MRTSILALAAAAAFFCLPAQASHRHHFYGPSIGFGYGYSPFYSSWYGPWYGPQFGAGIHVGERYSARRGRTTERREQRSLKLYVYPAAGQSEAQTSEDRYECHVWAADESGHDPTLGAGSRADAESYTRAFTACMEGRSYVVK
jgi:hypothetical protein